MRRYRQNFKENPDKIEVARAKDRERKRLKRLQQREEIVNGNRALEEHVRAQNRKHMKAYRKKIKSNKSSEKDNNSEKVNSSNINKQKAVLKTQRWRLKVKLASPKPPRSETASTEDNSAANTNDTCTTSNDTTKTAQQARMMKSHHKADGHYTEQRKRFFKTFQIHQ